jgi:N-acetylglucosaminyldiphosphoundecaprenol N-acetyl-beta-D-mannosaminyltransferase
MNKKSFLGLDLVDSKMSEFLTEITARHTSVDNPKIIFTPNPEMYVEASKNPEFFKVLTKADYLLPDGFGIQLWSRLLFGFKFKSRLTGVDFMKLVLEQNFGSVFLLGGSQGSAEIVQKKYFNVVDFYDGKVSDDFNDTIVEKINASGAEIVFVGLGAPKQEFWIVKNVAKLKNVKLIAGVGGSIDFLAGKQIRAPKILRIFGLEWLFRLCAQPKRFFRIWNAVIVFSLLCIKKKSFD